MWRWVGFTVGGVVVVAAGLWVGLVLALRSKHPGALAAIRRFNRRVSNPRVMATAGRPGASASVIRHVGRRTGRPHETPVDAVETEDGFAIALPYGTSPDWLQNLLAAGSAELIHEGTTVRVADPKVTGPEGVDGVFSSRERWIHRLYGVDTFLRLRRTPDQEATA